MLITELAPRPHNSGHLTAIAETAEKAVEIVRNARTDCLKKKLKN